ncbi:MULTISPECIES: hypothetical protein [unclassified Breznakia]|uniref:hypothetical protein n=1 Tax=unclassified Breznakia TaxID=2623764 RepID=UPI002476120F|nr:MULTISPECIES: hypothetical protein [unclassified Breznakia]MDH6367404.1 hypothetical protein [Breznakia sp. PH1-1]MDH6403936.1 hypothetical protein [Breznakia sp. PF1-11]MDH6411645.1 hypothetical protein [Breznakia sp. PFB1-11]MDH6414571.1 hypothetical protein [Breznakia sp. PFB1-14]MDH6418677.1 hypothetical protein [Breznakia sp. PFB1-12]
MFLQEKELKEMFWKYYNSKGRALKYQFECAIRTGNADLVTIEKYQENFQINAFEFKLDDIKKVILQAEGNLPYANKSWIVVPIEKKDLILNKYESALKEKKYIGVIGVSSGGKWEIIHQPYFKKEVIQNQAILNLCMKGY